MKNYRHCASWVAFVIIHRSKGILNLSNEPIQAANCVALRGWRKGSSEHHQSPRIEGAQLGLGIPLFHTPFHTATHRDTQGRSVPSQPAWSCLPFLCSWKSSCARGLLCLFLLIVSLLLFAGQLPEGWTVTTKASLFYPALSVQCMSLSVHLSACLSVSACGRQNIINII